MFKEDQKKETWKYCPICGEELESGTGTQGDYKYCPKCDKE